MLGCALPEAGRAAAAVSAAGRRTVLWETKQSQGCESRPKPRQEAGRFPPLGAKPVQMLHCPLVLSQSEKDEEI